LAALAAQKTYNRKFAFVAPTFSEFLPSITGKVARSVILADAKAAIMKALTDNYGKDSVTRQSKALTNKLNEIISATGYFSDKNAEFTISVTGIMTPTVLSEMVCLDATMAEDNIVLTYL